ncbi:MAG: hypothetical protein WBF10_03480 [Methylovirgula sp.]
MSKMPQPGLTAYHYFFLQYGQFLAVWNSFDVLVEIAIMRALRLSVEESCILSGALGFGAKSNVLLALLNRSPEEKQKVQLITEAIQVAERNGFAHGFISVSADSETFTLVRREVKGSLEVKPKAFSALQMQKHLFVFMGKFAQAQQAFSISDDDLIKYQREVESFAKAHPTPKSSSPRPATSFREAKRESRRGRKARRKAETQKR